VEVAASFVHCGKEKQNWKAVLQLEYTFSKRVLCDFVHFVGLDIYLLVTENRVARHYMGELTDFNLV
jgi:hypothetical protein